MSTTQIKHRNAANKNPPENSLLTLVKVLRRGDLQTQSGGFGSPSIIQHDGQLLLVYQEPILGRFFKVQAKSAYLAKLDAAFNPHDIQPLLFDVDYDKYTVGDIRFFFLRGELWYSGVLVDLQNTQGYQRTFISKYNLELIPQKITLLNYGSSETDKNWAFFEKNGELYCTYSIWQGKHNVCHVNTKMGFLTLVCDETFPLDSAKKWMEQIRPTSHYILRNGVLCGMYHARYADLNKGICGLYKIDGKSPYKVLNINVEHALYNDSYKVFSVFFPTGLFEYNSQVYTSVGIFQSNQNEEGAPFNLLTGIYQINV